MKRCFLFRRRTEPDWSRARCAAFWLWNAGWLLLAAVGLTGATLLLVSHSGEQITKLCSKALWLDKGHVKMYGPAEEVCRAYSQM